MELAADLASKAATKVKVTSARASYQARSDGHASHFKPMTLTGKKSIQIRASHSLRLPGIREDAGRTARSFTNSLPPP